MGRSIARWGLAVALGIALISSACGDEASNDADRAEDDAEVAGGTPVAITNFVYEPQELTVAPGTKVTWTNKDSAPHNVQDISELNIRISIDLKQGETFSITYQNPGSYSYICSLHPFMTGTVKVV